MKQAIEALRVLLTIAVAAGLWCGTEPGLAAQTAGAAEPKSALDFGVYRTRIEPIFLRPRSNGPRCYDCHSTLVTRLRLEKLAPGSESWSEEQSRRNLATVSQLISRSEPLKSRLLLHPLAQEAGGDPVHTGGKFWSSRDDSEWKTIANWVGEGARLPDAGSVPSQTSTTDASSFQVFRNRVEPIFLKQRPGHARCYSCHTLPNRVFRLAVVTPGRTDWTEDQSRQNFHNALQLVAPGDPGSSQLLLHPLAPEAGGDAFHSGGRQFSTQADSDWFAIAEWVRGLRPEIASAASRGVIARIYVTNSAGNTIDVIDPTTNKVVQVIRGIELPHGVAVSPDGQRVYVSNESDSVLDVVNRSNAQIIATIPLSGRPNNLALTVDGARVLVGIRAEPGAVDVIDTTSLKRMKSIPVHGSVHNVFVTPDGKYAVSGSIEGKIATVIDLQLEQVAWELKMDRGVRPMTFETNPDGSTKRIFMQLSGFNGFCVIDFAKRAEVARIKFPDEPGGFGTVEGRNRNALSRHRNNSRWEIPLG